jgi:hypothetical protein
MQNPAAQARALGDIQQRGLRAAGDIVDRMIGAVDGVEPRRDVMTADAAGADGERVAVPASPNRPNQASPNADIAQIWLDLFRRGLQAMAIVARQGGAATPRNHGVALVALDAGRPTGLVRIRVIRFDSYTAEPATSNMSATGSAEMHLHNGTAEPIHDLRVHCGDLRAHDGASLPGSAVRFDPPLLDQLSARSSRRVLVEADVCEDVPSGVYRGVILVTGAPEVWLPLEVTLAGSSR